jgi:Calpain family cysteine protease
VALEVNLLPFKTKEGKPILEMSEYITHIFGTYTVNLHFIGFKTSNGKLFFYGDPHTGTPFIIGQYMQKLHGVRMALSRGISYLKPNFRRGPFSTTIPKDDSNYKEPELIDDEEVCQKLEGEELDYALYYSEEDELLFTKVEAGDKPGTPFEKLIFGDEKVILPSVRDEKNFNEKLKKKINPLLKVQKTKKESDAEEQKKRHALEQQAELIRTKKSETRASIKFSKPLSINDKITEKTEILYGQKPPKTGAVFTDDIFKPFKTSLIPVDNQGNNVVPEGVLDEEIEEWPKIKWTRAQEIYDTESFQVILGNIEPGDILQGSLGNCYFLSAIATIAEERPDLIPKRFLFKEKSNESCYGVCFRVNGRWKVILLDDYFPCMETELAFTRSNGEELWVLLLEKAWAKLCGSYANIIGGMPNEVFNSITPSFTENIDISLEDHNALWKKLKIGEEKNFLMSAGTGTEGKDMGLEPGHAYSLFRAVEYNDKGTIIRLLQLRNPWGEGEWTGDYSDNSSKWTSKLKEAVNFTNAPDGKFWMDFDNFVQYFVVCNICKNHVGYFNHEINLSKNDTDKPVISETDINEDGTHVYFQIHQKYKRFRLRDGSFPVQVIFNLILVDENFKFIDGVFSDENIDCVEATLNKGKYYLISDINYRFMEGTKPHGYALTTYSNKQVVLKKIDMNPGEALKKALINYSKERLKPITPFEMTLFERTGAFCYRRIVNPFPGGVIIYENNTDDLTFDGIIDFNECEGAGLYDFNTHLTTPIKEKVQIEIKPKSSEVVFIRHHGKNPQIGFVEKASRSGLYCPMELRETEEMLQEATFKKGDKSKIDPSIDVFKYVLEHPKGYGIGFENKTKKSYRIAVDWILLNLIYISKGKSRVAFDLKPGERFFAFLRSVNNARKSSYEEEIELDII